MSTPRQVDLTVIGAWRRGTLIFDGAPFAQAIAELDRYHPGQIINLSSERAKPVSGVFSLSQLDDALEALAATQGLQVARFTEYLVFLH
jgi:transmembrane sensor